MPIFCAAPIGRTWPQADGSSWTRTATTVALLIALSAYMAVARLHTYDEPLEMDAATYAVIARELRAGRHLYSEMWDHKPPAVHVTFAAAQVVAGTGPAHIFLLGLGTAVATLLGVYVVGAAIAGRGAALLAAVFWAATSADLGLQANQPNTEVFINAALVWALALLATLPVGRLALGHALTAGGLLAAASLYKHVAAVPAGAMLAVHLLVVPPSARARRRAAVQFLVIGAVIAAAWCAVALYFVSSDRFDDFWGAVVTFNQQYAGSTWANLREGLVADRLVPPVMYPALPLVVVAILGLIGGDMSRRSRLMLAAWAAGTACAVALPGQFHPHYYQLWLPVVAVGAGVGLATLQPRALAARPWLIRSGAAVTMVLLAAQLPSLAEQPEEWARRKFGERLVRNTATARAVDAALLPGETFFEWGHEAELYYYSGRRPPAGEFRCRHLLHGPRQRVRTARLLADLRRTRPELVLVSRAHPFPLDHAVPRWLLANYDEGDATLRALLLAGDHRVLLRRDGALAQRLRDRAVAAAAVPGVPN